ncbi:MAG TPA: aldo/keto reductase [Myxococcaceae bacterium]|jgi:aryl-alcohol dehydrogenase-like predicted oxidoreductase
MAPWLDPEELRIGLGCMRLSTDPEPDESRAIDTIRAAVEAGVTVFDTARAYGDNERWLASALKAAGATARARVVTKGGMRRPEGRWMPDGRGIALRADCEESLAALDGVPIDLYLLHAPDPRTSWSTSVRALAGLVDQGLVRRVGLSNVNRKQLDEALELAPIAAVEVSLSIFDDEPLRGGVVARCEERGLAVIAHSPLGGVARAGTLSRDAVLSEEAARLGATPQELALAALLDAHPSIVAIPGARRPETARSAARAARLQLDETARARLRPRLAAPSLAPRTAPPASGAEVVLVMGLQGSGKSDAAGAWVARGHERLNRDARGGTLKDLNKVLEAALAERPRPFVLDNTYVTRAQRRDVIEVAHARGVPVRGIWLDISMAQAQVNVVLRMLDAHGRLLSPDELKRGKGPTQLSPNSLFRTARELEPPSHDEGFDTLERIAFQRRPSSAGAPARLLAWDAVLDAEGRPTADAQRALGPPGTRRLVFGWKPDADAAQLARSVVALDPEARFLHCPHPAGPPVCWCRPPLPGLPLLFAREAQVDLSCSTLVGTGAPHRNLAAALGCSYEE